MNAMIGEAHNLARIHVFTSNPCLEIEGKSKCISGIDLFAIDGNKVMNIFIGRNDLQTRILELIGNRETMG